MNSKDNQEIDSKNLLVVTNKFLMPRETFQNLYYPVYIKAKKDAEMRQVLVKQLQELQRMEWELMINSATN